MGKIIFTKEQLKELSRNKHVKKCCKKAITYSEDFKVQAVKQYYDEYLTPKEIFKEAGFDLEIIGKKMPGWCLDRWKKVFQNKGVMFLSTENRGKGGGRPKKIKDKSDKDKIERLEATVVYLKAENDFLAKLRAKRNY